MPTDSPTRSRRTVLTTALGLSALAAGSWFAWRRHAGPAHQAGDAPPAPLWTSVFDTPSGGSLKLADHRGHPIVLNFWATWCPPCVKELPTLNAFHRDYSARGWRVLGLAIDSPTPVRTFLARTPVSYPVGLAGLGGTDLAASLGDTQGGLPFTVVLGADGLIKTRKLGACEPSDLRAWAQRFS